MKLSTARKFCIAFALLGCSALSAKEHVIEMRNQSGTESMVFVPAFVEAAVGDTILFKTTQGSGHHAETVLVPKPAKNWHTKIDRETRINITTEGLYLYICEPHLPMGMVGIVQVGRPVNLKEARATVERYEKKISMNKGRFQNALAQVKTDK